MSEAPDLLLLEEAFEEESVLELLFPPPLVKSDSIICMSFVFVCTKAYLLILTCLVACLLDRLVGWCFL